MYERGEREPGLDMLEAIADTFNVDLDYLSGKSDIPRKSFIPDQTQQVIPIFNAEENTLINKYRRLDKYGKKAVNQLIDTEIERCSEQSQTDTVTVRYAARSPQSQGAGTMTMTQQELEALKNAPSHNDMLDD